MERKSGYFCGEIGNSERGLVVFGRGGSCSSRNLVIVFGREELKSLILSVVRLTVSKALVRSKEVTIVRREGLWWLKPAAMGWEIF